MYYMYLPATGTNRDPPLLYNILESQAQQVVTSGLVIAFETRVSRLARIVSLYRLRFIE